MLKFTKEAPSVAGYYWCRFYSQGVPHVYIARIYTGVDMVWYADSVKYDEKLSDLIGWGVEFAGPMEEPE